MTNINKWYACYESGYNRTTSSSQSKMNRCKASLLKEKKSKSHKQFKKLSSIIENIVKQYVTIQFLILLKNQRTVWRNENHKTIL